MLHTALLVAVTIMEFRVDCPSSGAGLVTFEVAGMTSNGNGGNSGIDGQPAMQILKIFPSIILHQRQMSY